MPAACRRGANYFITDGYVYEPGTLTCTDGVCDGVVYDDAGTPSPEFPDPELVIDGVPYFGVSLSVELAIEDEE